jgi:hypothetical protein
MSFFKVKTADSNPGGCTTTTSLLVSKYTGRGESASGRYGELAGNMNCRFQIAFQTVVAGTRHTSSIEQDLRSTARYGAKSLIFSESRGVRCAAPPRVSTGEHMDERKHPG